MSATPTHADPSMLLRSIQPWLHDESVENLCRVGPPGGLLVGNGDSARVRCTELAADLKRNSSHLSASTFPTCAVVGSGASLARSGLGSFIDRHAAVFRINLAPTSRWQKDVGARTNLRVSTHCAPCIRSNSTTVVAPALMLSSHACVSCTRAMKLYSIVSALTTAQIPGESLSPAPDHLYIGHPLMAHGARCNNSCIATIHGWENATTTLSTQSPGSAVHCRCTSTLVLLAR